MMTKRLMAGTMAFALAIAPMLAEAKLGGNSGSSRTQAVTTVRPASPAVASTPASQRIGGGQTAGLSRPDVMARVRSEDWMPRPAAVPTQAWRNDGAARPRHIDETRAPQPAPARKGPGWGTVAGAAALAGVAGYAIADSGNHHVAPAPAAAVPNNPGVAPQQGAVSSDWGSNREDGRLVERRDPSVAMNALAPSGLGGQKDSGFSPWAWLLGLLLGGAALFAMWKQKSQGSRAAFAGGSARPSPTPQPMYRMGNRVDSLNEDPVLISRAAEMFQRLQDLNNAGDLEQLQMLIDEPLFSRIKADIETRNGPGQTKIVRMTTSYVDATEEPGGRLVSVRYKGVISESPDAPPEALDEVWHFRDRNGMWMLAGIEQV